MLEFEESIELNRLEIEESENKIVEFECQMERDRNEGLFFKNLGYKAPIEKAKAKEEEVEKIKDVNSESIAPTLSEVKTFIMVLYISCTPRIEAADVGLGYFPIHPLHAQHLLGLVCEHQMVGARRSGSEGEVPG
ncbi:hypothetical protein JHK85_001373 [Glycine max]|nr:hypothetical protein JHK85_001373 [Glycine max]KAG5088726.1 hypothetical protein JHK86_001338 [Glycine max]